MLDAILISFVILFFTIVVISKAIAKFILKYHNWISLVRFIKKSRQNNNCVLKINTTSDKIIITTNDWRNSNDKKERLSLDY
jgi:hypothetical protein